MDIKSSVYGTSSILVGFGLAWLVLFCLDWQRDNKTLNINKQMCSDQRIK